MRDAAALFRSALVLDPGRADHHAGLAEALFRGGALAESEAAWRNAVALAPQRPELHYGLAEVLRHRVIPTYEAEAEGLDTDQIVARVLETVPVP